MQIHNSVSWAIASAIALSGAAATTVMAQEPALVGPLWQLEEIVYNNDTMTMPDDPADYSIQFFEDGSLGVRADCNVGNGVFDVDSSDFITLQAFTLAACGPDSLDDEFRQGLDNAVNHFFQDGAMYMDLLADAGTMKFVAADAMVEAETEAVVVEEAVETETDGVIEAVESVETPPANSQPVPGLW